MGSSIGPANSQRSGTLGGVVTLEGGEVFGLSTWRLVATDELNTRESQRNRAVRTSLTCQVANETESKALEPHNERLQQRPQTMLIPATTDHENFIKTLEVRVQVFTRASLKEAEAGEENLSLSLQLEAQALLSRIKTTDRALGTVAADSGYRTALAPPASLPGAPLPASKALTEFPLDWSLTLLTPHKTPHNRLPPTTPHSPRLQPHQLSNTWTSPSPQRHCIPVAKYGRSSGWTVGAINSASTHINPRNDCDMSTEFAFETRGPGCYSIVADAKSCHRMVEKGDEGSIALHDGEGTWVGMIIGVTGAGCGVMVPIEVVFADIEKVTGKRVVAPKWIGMSTSRGWSEELAADEDRDG